jgi:hypothetical protein
MNAEVAEQQRHIQPGVEVEEVVTISSRDHKPYRK